MLVLLITPYKYIISEFELFVVLRTAFRKDYIGERFNIDDIREYIPEDHPCYLIEEIVGRMDFSKWEEDHWDTHGNPAYHPRVILRPIILGYVEELASGRAIARRVRTDIAYIYLCGFDALILGLLIGFIRIILNLLSKPC